MKTAIGILSIIGLLVGLLGITPFQTQAATQGPDFIVPGGLWSTEAVIEAVATQPLFREAISLHGSDPDRLLSVEEVVSVGFRQTIDANFDPSPRMWIEDGEKAWQLTFTSGSELLVKKECGNPPIPGPLPPPPPAPADAILQINKVCGPRSGPFLPCSGARAYKVESEGWEIWLVDPRPSETIVIPGILLGKAITVTEDSGLWTAVAWYQTLLLQPGEVGVVTFQNWREVPPPPSPPPPPPSGPEPSPTITPIPTETPIPPPTVTPSPTPTETPGPEPTKANNGVGQEKHGKEDGQPPGIISKPGLDNDRTGRTDTNPGQPTGENQSRGGNKGETPGGKEGKK